MMLLGDFGSQMLFIQSGSETSTDKGFTIPKSRWECCPLVDTQSREGYQPHEPEPKSSRNKYCSSLCEKQRTPCVRILTLSPASCEARQVSEPFPASKTSPTQEKSISLHLMELLQECNDVRCFELCQAQSKHNFWVVVAMTIHSYFLSYYYNNLLKSE